MEKDWKTLVDHGFIIAGSPDTVADRLIEAAKGLRIGNLIALLQIGSMGHELTKQNLTLFAEGVLPKIKAPVGRRGVGAPVVAPRRPPGRARVDAGRFRAPR